ncbi:hypothetical protein AYJ54_37125 [Bradyrhizobium centrolobii]|uniref:Uncharacterized protein n=1 Tax=Bradyrhizobium centrolobii TaxID=1505087 RepID=A0A176Z9W6_9BRAD|nr:hypothetical protein AYJ54_37125 [Bradyrhizobium centrolobii]
MKLEMLPPASCQTNALQDDRRARRALGSFAFPSASARHDGRRLHKLCIQDSEALVHAGAPLVEIAQSEKGAALRIDGGLDHLRSHRH